MTPFRNFRNQLYKIKVFIHDIFLYADFTKKSVNYNHYWEVRFSSKNPANLNSFQLERVKFIENNISHGSSVIDIGAGDGGSLAYLRKSRAIKPYATDISDVAIEYLSKNNIPAQKMNIKSPEDINALPHVDYVCALEVLEHLPNSEDILLALLNQCKIGVFISFPNTGYIKDRLRLMFGKFPVQWRAHPGEHIRFWTYSDLRWWLKQLQLYDKSKIYLYEGTPFLNRLFPSLFAKAMIVYIRK